MAVIFGIILFPFAIFMLLIAGGIVIYVFNEKPAAGFGLVLLILTLLFPALLILVVAALVIFGLVEFLKWKSGMR